MDNPRNILEALLYGLETTNTNVVDVSKEIIALREDVAMIKSFLTIQPEAADGNGKKTAAKPKQ